MSTYHVAGNAWNACRQNSFSHRAYITEKVDRESTIHIKEEMIWKTLSGMEKNEQGQRCLEHWDEGQAPVLSTVIRVDFIEKVTSVHRFKGEEGVCQAEISVVCKVRVVGLRNEVK